MFGVGGTTVGELQVRVTADTSAMAAKIAATANTAGRASAASYSRAFVGSVSGANLTRVGTTVSQSLAQAAAPIQAQAAATGQAAGQAMANAQATSYSKAWRVAGVAAVAAGVAGAAGLGAIVSMGVKTAAANEQAAISFEVLMGSSEAAKKQLDALAKFAAETPFDLPGLRDAASRLQAVGVKADDVIPLMRALGDATSAMGTGAVGIDRAVRALGQMQQKGKVMAQEMLQLTEAGIPAWDALAAQMNVSVAEAQEMVTAGKVEVKDMFSALESYSGESMQRVQGMMDKQSQTLVGLFSTLKDNVSQTLGLAAAPLVDGLKDVLPAVQDMAVELGDALAPAFGSIADIVGALTPIAGAIGDVFAALANNITGILADTLTALGPAFEALAPVIVDIVNMLGAGLGDVLPALAGHFSRIVEAVMPLVEVLVGVLEPVLPILSGAFAGLLNAIAPVIDVIAEVAAILGDAFAQHMAEIAPLLTELGAALTSAFSDMGPTFKELAVAMVPVAQEFAKLIPEMTTLAVELIPLLIPLVQMLGQYMATSGATQVMMLVAAFTALMKAGMFVMRAFITVVNGVRKFVSDLQAAWAAITGGVSAMVAAVTGFFSNMVSGIGSAINTAVAVVSGLPGRLLGAVGDLGSLLWNAGASLIQGLINGITSKIGEVSSTLGNLTSSLPSWKGPPARDATLLTPNGQLVIDGFVKGLKSREGEVKGYLSQLTGEVGTVKVTRQGAWTVPQEAAGSIKGAEVTYVTNITNPVPEKASESLPAALRRATFQAGWAL